jgi:hypothetical protein
MAESFRTESVLFNVAEVSLPFNAIQGRPALYQFMTVARYGYLVLKMSSPNGVLRIRGDHDAGVCALEKLQALVRLMKLLQSLGAGPRATKLALAWLGLSTLHATLCQGRCPHKDRPGQG